MASDDFNASPFYGYSLNNGIDGDIRNVLFDTRFSTYPFPVWAAALLYDPMPEFNFKFGSFQTSKDMFNNNDHDLNWSISQDDGYTAILQFGWAPRRSYRKRSRATSRRVVVPAICLLILAAFPQTRPKGGRKNHGTAKGK